jgi:hypothetical protein
MPSRPSRFRSDPREVLVSGCGVGKMWGMAYHYTINSVFCMRSEKDRYNSKHRYGCSGEFSRLVRQSFLALMLQFSSSSVLYWAWILPFDSSSILPWSWILRLGSPY